MKRTMRVKRGRKREMRQRRMRATQMQMSKGQRGLGAVKTNLES